MRAVGKLQNAEFAEGIIIEIIGDNDVLWINLTQE